MNSTPPILELHPSWTNLLDNSMVWKSSFPHPVSCLLPAPGTPLPWDSPAPDPGKRLSHLGLRFLWILGSSFAASSWWSTSSGSHQGRSEGSQPIWQLSLSCWNLPKWFCNHSLERDFLCEVTGRESFHTCAQHACRKVQRRIDRCCWHGICFSFPGNFRDLGKCLYLEN